MLDKPEACSSCKAKDIGLGFVPQQEIGDVTIEFIGEAPGQEEAAAGGPWVGPAGNILHQAVRSCGLSDGLRFGNSINCRPPGNAYNLIPKEAISYCQEAYYKAGKKAAITFACGASALHVYYPQLQSIERWSGSILPKPGGGVLVPLLHPSGIMRGNWPSLPTLRMGIQGVVEWGGQLPSIPKLIDISQVISGPVLEIDVETDRNGEIDLIGVSTDGIYAGQGEPSRYNLLMLQELVDAAKECIFAHNAKFDIQKLERLGIHFDRSRVVCTLILQAFYQSDLEVGLDKACAITLAGKQTYWKSLDGEAKDRLKDREVVRWIWGLIHPPWARFGDKDWPRPYNGLDVIMGWRLGVELKRRVTLNRV